MPTIHFDCPQDIYRFLERATQKESEVHRWNTKAEALRDIIRTYMREHPLEIIA